MLVRAISLEKSVPETLLFGAPSFQLSLRRRLPSLLPAPVNASNKGETCRCHTLKVREVTTRKTPNRLLQIFEILLLQIFEILHSG